MEAILDLSEELFGLLLVLLASGAIGFEREIKSRPAGLRTHLLVGVAVWLLVTTSAVLVSTVPGVEGGARPDPTRVLEAVVAGVAFIGAGMIFVSDREERVAGLTTAASLLANASVSAAIASGLRVLGLIVTGVVVIILWLLARLEKRALREGGR